MLVVVDTHPVQYHAPVYRALQQQFGVPVTAVYGTDCSVRGYTDAEFGTRIAWDTDLVSGYTARFLSTVAGGGAPTPEAATTIGLEEVLRSLAPQAVLLGGYGTPFHRAAWRIVLQAGTPLLFRGETTDSAVDRPWWKQRLRDAVLRRAYQRCAALLYIGEASRAHYRRLGVPETRLVFSPYCVDASTFTATEADRVRLRAPTRRSLGIADDDLVVLFCGKVSARKGADLAVRAVRGLPYAVQRRVVLLMVGDGPLRANVEAAARRPKPVRVRFAGFQPQRALSAFYHAADVLLVPSRHGETWGLVVNEALMHGVPCVVSTRVGCAPDLIAPGGVGVVAAADSAERLAHGLMEALPLCGRADVRDACRRAVAPYTVERAAAGLAEAMGGVPTVPADVAV